MKWTQLGLQFSDQVRRTQVCHLRTPLLICCWTAGVAIACCDYGGIRLNSTGSLPLGLYRVTKVPNAPLAEFCPPEPFSRMSVERGYRPSGVCLDGNTPLLKPIVARPGDVVVTSERGISVNGQLLRNTVARTKDSKGRPLPHYQFGS
jgi:conjugative transfer signal peptidase TraF